MLGINIVITEEAKNILAEQYHSSELEACLSLLNIKLIHIDQWVQKSHALADEVFKLDFSKNEFVLSCETISQAKLKLNLAQEYLKLQKQNKTGPLKKALGSKFIKGTPIVDATCGTGKDSLLLLFYGAKVIAYERHPLLFFLLKISFDLFFKSYSEHCNNFELHFGSVADHVDHLKNHSIKYLYYDPMFDHGNQKKSALPRQEMVFFKYIAGQDLDQEDLLALFLTWQLERIIVKRPLSAKLWGIKTIATFPGKAVRYDLFKGKF